MNKDKILQALKIAYLHLSHYESVSDRERESFLETLRDILAIEGYLPEEEKI